jgi:hypothetical protein
MPFALTIDAEDGGPERLTGDDLATRREEEFLQVALRDQQRRGARSLSTPGLCSNCGEACLPLAVYCDADCREDHEARQRMASGRGPAA